MVIILRHSILTLLILLQLVAPLLHAHSGVELTNDSLHLPGMEAMDNHYSGSDTLRFASQHEACGVAVGISIGIPHIDNLSSANSPFIIENTFLSANNPQSVKLIFYQLEDYLPKPPIQTNVSRAPPYLTL
jgi:hypothetical protein